MNIDEFAAITAERIPTAEEFIEFAKSQEWSINLSSDNRATLRVPDKSDVLAVAFAKMLSREPYRTEVVKTARQMDRQPPKECSAPNDSTEDEGHECEQCGGTWYCSPAEIREAVQSTAYCAKPRCPYRTTK